MQEATVRAIVDGLKDAGIDFVVYMPDSFFFETINVLEADPDFECVSVPNESVGMCLAAGACLFFASDLAVARDRFVARDFTNKLWGLPAYYIGQLLIAWAIAA